jgi:purine-binding chemotaxis protein CheW
VTLPAHTASRRLPLGNERMESKRDVTNNPASRTPFGYDPHPSQAKPHEEMLQLVSFCVGGEKFALDILRVLEIIRLPELTRVPSSPEFMDGVMNLRGKIIPVIALRARFGLPRVPPHEQTRIVLIEVKGSKIKETVVGVIVDSVSEILRIPADSIALPPLFGKVDREYVAGVGKLDDRLFIVLDADQLMDDRLMKDAGEISGVAVARAQPPPERKSP